MIIHYSAVSHIYPCITGGSSVTGTSCAAGVEDKYAVTVFCVSAMCMTEQRYLAASVCCLKKQSVNGKFNVPFMTMSVKYPVPVGESAYVAFGSL